MLFEIALVAAMLVAGDVQVDTLDKQQHRGARWPGATRKSRSKGPAEERIRSPSW